jgi:RHS repeat-associated protein
MMSPSHWFVEDGAHIDNGTIRLGVSEVASFMPWVVSPRVGLEYIPTGHDVLTPGCYCEGWGIADIADSVDQPTGYHGGGGQWAVGMEVLDFQSDSESALSVVNVADVFEVAHEFFPLAATDNLYVVNVSIENTTNEWARPKYRRSLDWDVEPTAFDDIVSSEGANPAPGSESRQTNDGFIGLDPSDEPNDPVSSNATLIEGLWSFAGPGDQGYHVDLDFGQIPPNHTLEFSLFYGAADTVNEARGLAREWADLYSLARPDPSDPAVGEDGSPNTFIFGVSREPVDQTRLGKRVPDWHVSDPVSVVTGNMFDTRTDLTFPVFGLDLVRAYNSLGSYTTGWGTKWASTFTQRLKPVGDESMDFLQADGRTVRFVRASSVSPWERPPDFRGGLIEESGGYRIVWDAGGFTRFDSSGRLVELADGEGQRVEVSYDSAGSLDAATHFRGTSATGFGIDFVDSDEDGLVDEAIASDGRIVSYEYEAGHLNTVSQPHFPTEQEYGIERYEVGPHGRLEEIWIDDNSSIVPSRMLVKNEYDGKGRVWQQTTEEGDVVTLDFDFAPGQTKVTYAGSGDEHIFTYNEDAEVIGVEDPYGQPIERDFDDGQPAGFVTRRAAEYHNEYDTKGRLRRRLHPDPETGLLGYAEEVFTYVGDPDPNSTDTRVKTYTNAEGETVTYGYDGDSRIPRTVTVAEGTSDEGVTTFDVASDGLVNWVEDADGVRTCFEYDPVTRQLDEEKQACGTSDESVTTYTYNAMGLVETVTVEGTPPETTTYDYDGRGRIRTIQGPIPEHDPVVYEYWPTGELKSVTDEEQHTTAYEHERGVTDTNVCGDVGVPCSIERVIDANLEVVDSVYDINGDLREVREPGGAVTRHFYGPLARLERTVDPEGVETHFCYDQDGNQIASVVTPDPVDCSNLSGLPAELREYDTLGRLEAEVDPTGLRTEYRYDRVGRVTHTIAAAGTAAESVTENKYDYAGRLWKTLTPPPDVETFDWGNSALDGQKLVETRTYTPAGRLATLTSPGFHSGWPVTTRYEYDDAGRLKEEYSPLAEEDPNDDFGPTMYGYDHAGRVTSVTTPEGRIQSTEYDAAGRVTFKRTLLDADTTKWSSVAYTYTPRGELETETVPYEGIGSAPSPIAMTAYEYWPTGDLHAVIDPNGGRTEYAYDGRGNRTHRETYDPDADPSEDLRIVQRWEYDLANRLTEAWRSPGDDLETKHHHMIYSYEDPLNQLDNGLLRTRIDGSGRVETIDYDPARRVEKRAFQAGSETFDLTYAHDPAGRVNQITDSRTPNDPLTQSWDVRGNLIELDRPNENPLNWNYGPAGNVVYRSHKKEHHFYDENGRLIHTVQTPGGWQWYFLGGWNYDRDGLPIEENHFLMSFVDYYTDFWGTLREFDDGGRMHFYAQANYDPSMNQMNDIVWAELGHDEAGNVTTEGRVTLGWDDAYQSTQVDWSHRGYDYDDAGQLREVTIPNFWGSNNPLVLDEFTYDIHGRRQTHTTGSGTTTYDWSPVGQLDALEHPSGPDTTFTYDDAGRRTSQDDGDFTTVYDYDPAGRLQERNHLDDTLTATWAETRTYDPGGSLRQIALDDFTTVTNTELSWDPTSPVPQLARWREHQDNQLTKWIDFAQGLGGQPIANNLEPDTKDPYGSNLNIRGPGFETTAAAQRFDEFGNPRLFNDAGPGEPASHTYLGYRSEVHTGDLIHLRNRDYDPATATFTTPDPLDGVDGTTTVANPYHYADNDPINKVDPLGLRPCDTTLECFLKTRNHPGGLSGKTPVACTGEGFPPELKETNRIEPLYYDCRIYEVADAGIGWWRRAFAPTNEPSTVHFGMVAVSASASGVSPEWVLLMQNQQYLAKYGFAPWVNRQALTPASAVAGLVGIIATGGYWQGYEARTDRYQDDARVVDPLLLATNPSFAWAVDPNDPWFAPNRTILLVRKKALNADCRHWRQVAAAAYLIVTSPLAGNWKRCSDVKL